MIKGTKNGQASLTEELILQGYGEQLKKPITEAAGFLKMDVSTPAVGIVVPTIAGKDIGGATIMCEAADNSTRAVRYKEGGTPTTIEGLWMGDGDILEVDFETLNNINFISTSATTYVLQIQFYERIGD